MARGERRDDIAESAGNVGYSLLLQAMPLHLWLPRIVLGIYLRMRQDSRDYISVPKKVPGGELFR